MRLFPCSRCKMELPIESFNKSSGPKNGLYPVCKTCRSILRDREKELHPERVAERSRRAAATYRSRHREELRAKDRARAKNTPPELRESKRLRERSLRTELPEQHILHGLKQRCRDPNHVSFQQYGGRGITVSSLFDGTNGLANFISAIGRRPSPSYSVERIDNSLGYEPGNIRWATAQEQQRNKRSNRRVEFNGRILCLIEWEEVTGIPQESIRARIDRLGWSIAKALTTPIRRRAA